MKTKKKRVKQEKVEFQALETSSMSISHPKKPKYFKTRVRKVHDSEPNSSHCNLVKKKG